MEGRDLSHHNSDAVFNSVLKDDKIGFIILKATEGKTYVDPKFRKRAEKVLESGKLLGAYHFCRPDNGNGVQEELLNFLAAIDGLTVRPFMDIEGNALSHTAWCVNIMALAKKELPNIGYYCSLSEVETRLKPLKCNYPLWVAHYHADDTHGCIHTDAECITQYTSNGIDKNWIDDDNPIISSWYGDTHVPDEIVNADAQRLKSDLIKFLNNWK